MVAKHHFSLSRMRGRQGSRCQAVRTHKSAGVSSGSAKQESGGERRKKVCAKVGGKWRPTTARQATTATNRLLPRKGDKAKKSIP